MPDALLAGSLSGNYRVSVYYNTDKLGLQRDGQIISQDASASKGPWTVISLVENSQKRKSYHN